MNQKFIAIIFKYLITKQVNLEIEQTSLQKKVKIRFFIQPSKPHYQRSSPFYRVKQERSTPSLRKLSTRKRKRHKGSGAYFLGLGGRCSTLASLDGRLRMFPCRSRCSSMPSRLPSIQGIRLLKSTWGKSLDIWSEHSLKPYRNELIQRSRRISIDNLPRTRTPPWLKGPYLQPRQFAI